MRTTTKNLMTCGLLLILASAVLRVLSGRLMAVLADAVSTGMQGEQRALGYLEPFFSLLIGVITPLGAALVAGALLLRSLGHGGSHELRPRAH